MPAPTQPSRFAHLPRIFRRAALLFIPPVLLLTLLTVRLLHNHAAQQAQIESALDTSSQPALELASTSSLQQRPVFPFSIIPGGVRDVHELQSAVTADPVVAKHYSDFHVTQARVVRLKQPLAMRVMEEAVDYRFDGKIAVISGGSRGIGFATGRRFAQSGESSPTPATSVQATGTADEQRLKLREEQLRVQKQPVETGEARVRKDVVSEQQSMEVPVTHEEVYVERRPGSGQPTDRPIEEGETYRVPVREEQVRTEKQTVETGEVALGKRQAQETKRVGDTVRREEAHVERAGEVNVQGSDGERAIPVSGFFTGYRKTAMRPGEIVVSVTIPKPLPPFARFYKIAKRRLELVVNEHELIERKSKWRAPKPALERGYWRLYHDHVLQADQGADLDFLVGKSGAFVPRDNH